MSRSLRILRRAGRRRHRRQPGELLPDMTRAISLGLAANQRGASLGEMAKSQDGGGPAFCLPLILRMRFRAIP